MAVRTGDCEPEPTADAAKVLPKEQLRQMYLQHRITLELSRAAKRLRLERIVRPHSSEESECPAMLLLGRSHDDRGALSGTPSAPRESRDGADRLRCVGATGAPPGCPGAPRETGRRNQ